MKTSELLKDAKKLIEDPENWTKEVWFKTPNGTALHADRAMMISNVQCCAYGALVLAGRLEYVDISSAYQTLTDIAHVNGFSGIAQLNDRGGHTKVMEMCNSAISLTEAEEAVNKV